MYTSNQIRSLFLEFFKSKGHHVVPSAPMVIKDDPTLMFTNAGMNQFKDIILGNAPIKYSRVADAQKCLRVSGKHNDLEEVGHDTYHHTMFEMLGNWSFGDYFKKDAIHWAWELLTEVYKIDPNNLYVTVFEGEPAEGLERDNEAAAYWAEVIPPQRILNGNKHDNFWEMGDTGPCGPCSEIHIDLRSAEEKANTPGHLLVNKDHPQVIEIWNLVFMQYNRKADGSLEPLPKQVIDTGMGFERLCMALQGKQSNYDTDVFTPLLSSLAQHVGKPYGQDEATSVAMRVIADHVRTVAFSVTDGQLPSNAKAGYVIRRILRRAVRYGYTFLGQQQAFMYKLIPTLVQTMGEAYPELVAQQEIITKVLRQEEEAFLRTLEMGIHILDNHINQLTAAGKSTLMPGKVIFELYDTYGFPADLTDLILREKGLQADLQGFAQEMEKQKSRARKDAAVEASDWVILKEGDTSFVGYDESNAECSILRYREVKKKGKTFFQLVLSTTPFYSEMGGQIGDQGSLTGVTNGEVVTIQDTVRENNLPIHLTDKMPTNPHQPFRAAINTERRLATEANHTATHLLHEALRKVLGTHVEQKGSFVSEQVLRFDFSHFQKMTREEVRKVEDLVNEAIRKDYPREEDRSVPIAKAKEMGAMALFGEKYGEEVRVIRFGSSVELCGGTHIARTGMIGYFRIVSESSIASGIRRVEAVTGERAEAYAQEQQDTLLAIQNTLQGAPNVVAAVTRLQDENESLKQQLKQLQDAQKEQIKTQLLANPTVVNGVKVFTLAQDLKSDMVKDLAFAIRAAVLDPFVFVAGSTEGDKCVLTLMLSDQLVQQGAHAGQLVKDAGKLIQGGGGGQPAFATAGGRKPDGLSAAIKHVLTALQLA